MITKVGSGVANLSPLLFFVLLGLAIITATTAQIISGYPNLKEHHPNPKSGIMTGAIVSIIATLHSLVILCPLCIAYHGHSSSGAVGFKTAIYTINGVMSLLMAAGLVTAVVQQRPSLPGLRAGACFNIDSRLFDYLDALAQAQNDNLWNDEIHICFNLVSNWQFEVAVVIILLLYGLLNLYHVNEVIGCKEIIETWIRYQNRRKERARAAATTVMGGRIGFRFWTKKNARPERRTVSRAEERLQLILTQYECFTIIAEECHYSDMANLMRVSRAVRANILGAIKQRVLLKKIICNKQEVAANSIPGSSVITRPNPSIPQKCFGCEGPICEDCYVSPRLLLPDTVRHLLYCKPCCGSCYRKVHCQHQRSETEKMLPGQCKCMEPKHNTFAVSRTLATQTQDYTTCFLTSDSYHPTKFVRPPILCKSCMTRTDNEVTATILRGKKRRMTTFISVESEPGTSDPGVVEVSQLLRAEVFVCLHCQHAFDKGEDVWWICSHCKDECLDEFHVHDQKG